MANKLNRPKPQAPPAAQPHKAIDLDAFAAKLDSLPRAKTEPDTWAEADGEAPIRRLRVVVGYRGRRTSEQYIAPGLYAETDPALHGLADFLLDSGRAVLV